MIHTIKQTKIMDCSDSTLDYPSTAVFACSDKTIIKLTPLNIKLIALKPKDTVNGSLSIDHGYGEFVNNKWINTDKILRPHTFTVEIYTNNESPNTRHKTTFEKPTTIPTKSEIEKLL